MGVWVAPEGTFTIEEFKRLPLEGRRWELLDGRVIQMEPHNWQTSLVTGHVLSLIHNMFLQAGTRLAWLIDPKSQTVMVFHSEIAPTMLKKGDILEGGDVLPAFSMPVADIFAESEG